MFITEFREKVIDFSEPFIDVQATLLLRKTPPGISRPIEVVEDLLNQSEIKYGTLRTGLLVWSFRNTNDTVSRILWRNIMRFGEDIFTDSNEEGISRVRRDKYAYILPSSIGEYIANRPPCDLEIIDRFLMDRGYGFAFIKKSPLKTVFNEAIGTLRRRGTLSRLYRKWWTESSFCNGMKSSRIYLMNHGHNGCLSHCSMFYGISLFMFHHFVNS